MKEEKENKNNKWFVISILVLATVFAGISLIFNPQGYTGEDFAYSIVAIVVGFFIWLSFLRG